jgi:hypothetical protein
VEQFSITSYGYTVALFIARTRRSRVLFTYLTPNLLHSQNIRGHYGTNEHDRIITTVPRTTVVGPTVSSWVIPSKGAEAFFAREHAGQLSPPGEGQLTPSPAPKDAGCEPGLRSPVEGHEPSSSPVRELEDARAPAPFDQLCSLTSAADGQTPATEAR